MNINQRLDKLNQILLSKELMIKGKQGGEICFHIFDYDPKDELSVRDFVKIFISQHSDKGSDLKPYECDLFNLMIEILKREKIKDTSILDLIPDMEAKDGEVRLEKALRSVLSPEMFVKLIQENRDDANLILITSVGKVWPFIRSHTILNNLHHILEDVPVVMFYPGMYDQKELRLFNLFKDDNYYRAFSLVANI